MIGDLLRAFVEALVIRELQPWLKHYGPPDAVITSVRVGRLPSKGGELPMIILWSTP